MTWPASVSRTIVSNDKDSIKPRRKGNIRILKRSMIVSLRMGLGGSLNLYTDQQWLPKFPSWRSIDSLRSICLCSSELALLYTHCGFISVKVLSLTFKYFFQSDVDGSVCIATPWHHQNLLHVTLCSETPAADLSPCTSTYRYPPRSVFCGLHGDIHMPFQTYN